MAWKVSGGSRNRRVITARQRPQLRGRWRRKLLALLAILLMGVALMQANGGGGAAVADFLRATIGPRATAQVEATYLNLADAVQRVRYRIVGQQVAAPWVVPPPVASAVPTRRGCVAATGCAAATTRSSPMPPAPCLASSGCVAAQADSSTRAPVSPVAACAASASCRAASPVLSTTPTSVPMSQFSIAPRVVPALADEGVWTASGLPAPGSGAKPPMVKTFLRPDPNRPWAIVTLLQVDLRQATLHVVAGIQEPGGPVNMVGSGLIPAVDYHGNRLLAVLNGGFKYADGAYGLMSSGTVYVSPVWGAATVAALRNGKVIMGRWGLDRRLTGANRNLVAWRQNGSLLIDHGRIAALTQDGASWGLSIMNSTYTWRSGIGLTARGTLLYAAGNSLSAATLAQALRDAGAMSAMQLDINPFWVRAFTYTRDPLGQLTATALNPAMQGTGTEYLYGHVRDFFYLTRRP